MSTRLTWSCMGKTECHWMKGQDLDQQVVQPFLGRSAVQNGKCVRLENHGILYWEKTSKALVIFNIWLYPVDLKNNVCYDPENRQTEIYEIVIEAQFWRWVFTVSILLFDEKWYRLHPITIRHDKNVGLGENPVMRTTPQLRASPLRMRNVFFRSAPFFDFENSWQ